MPITLDEFRQLGPEEQRTVLAEMRVQNADKIKAAVEEAVDRCLDRCEFEARLVPNIAFRPAPRQTVNLDPPRMSDAEVREKFRQDPNLKELTVGGVHYARI